MGVLDPAKLWIQRFEMPDSQDNGVKKEPFPLLHIQGACLDHVMMGGGDVNVWELVINVDVLKNDEHESL